MKKVIYLMLPILIIGILFSTSYFDLSKDNGIVSHKTKKSKQVDKPKFDIPFLFAEYHNLIRTRDGEPFPAYSSSQRLQEYYKAKALARKYYKEHPQAQLNWIERGPGNVGGRTRAFYVDPDDNSASTWIVGSVGGGLWKTTDKGMSWRNLTPDLPNLATTTIAYSKSNPDIIYVGTGEGFMNLDAINGNGIFKSTDRGETWTHLPNSAVFRSVNRIIVDPENADILLMCANNMDISGGNASRYYKSNKSTIHKSTNGGISWFEVYSAGTKRIQQLDFHPSDFNKQYATINAVGVIKSTNAGLDWERVGNDFTVGGRIEMAIAPTNPDKLYLNVEGPSGAILYCSSNGGEDWLVTKDTKRNVNWLSSQGWYDNCIAVSPYNEDLLYVGGVNIFQVDMNHGMDSSFTILEVEEVNTESFMRFANLGFPFGNGGIAIANDFLGEEVLAESEFTTVEIRFGSNRKQKAHRFTLDAEENPIFQDYVEVPFEVYDLDNFQQIMVSFVDMNNNNKFDILDSDTAEMILISQIRYDINSNSEIESSIHHENSYVIAPKIAEGKVWNPQTVPSSRLIIHWGAEYQFNRRMTAVTDGYGQYGNKNRNHIVHVDQHNITLIPMDDETEHYRMLIGNDGGVAYSDDFGENWTETDHNSYNTSQFYGCDKKHGADEYIGGTQDNGTFMTPSGETSDYQTAYNHVIGGDGFEAAWHYDNPNFIIGSSQFNNIKKTTDGGETWFSATKGLADGYGTGGPFVSKIAKSNQDPNLIFAVGKSGVWRSENFGDNWTLIDIADENWCSNGYYSNAQVEISLANPQVVWSGVLMSDKGKLNLSTDGGLTFLPVNNYDLVPLGRITGIESHPIEKNTAYALFSFANAPKILKTTDLGETWNDISGFDDDSVSKTGFPDVAVYSLIVMPYNTDIIWVGTDIGLMESVDGGESWHLADNGLSAVSIWQMRIVDDQVVIATHGRGIWSVTLDELEGYEPPEVTLSPKILKIGQNPIGELVVRGNLRSEYDLVTVYIRDAEGGLIESFELNSFSMGDNLLKLDYQVDSPQQIKVQLSAQKDDGDYFSSETSVTLYPLELPTISYLNQFQDISFDFGGSGFSIDTIPGFEGYSLQTAHKYPNNAVQQTMLLTPIIVADTNPIFKYDDIAIVEIGDSGTVYGDQFFYDYVVVEYTKDGFDWYPLFDGYDSRYDEDWLEVYENKGTVTEELFRNHTINLHDVVNERDTILIRFKLFADTYTNAWGWAVRNIDIQSNGVISAIEKQELHSQVRIRNVYPNPASDFTKIELTNNSNSNINLKLVDNSGRVVQQIVSGSFKEGRYFFDIPLHNLASGVYHIVLENENHKQIIKVIRN